MIMKQPTYLLSLLFLLSLLLLAPPALAQTSVPEIPYDAPAEYFSYPPEMNLGEITGVAVNSKGHVFMVSRSNATGNVYGGLATQLLEFDERGKFVREIGKGLYGFAYGHAVRVDPQDNVWVVDKGTNMVIKFNPAGKVVMVLGRREEATDEHVYLKKTQAKHVDGMFNEPTDVAWDRAGNIYVTDGYGNSRIAKYDRNGKWIKNWGSTGTDDGQFRVVKGIAIDAANNVYVADRDNKRIQVFDTEGNFKTQFRNVGSPWAICITPGARQFLYVSNSNPPNNLDYDGEILKMTLDGRIVGKFGRAGKMLKEFGTVNSIDCRNENELYVGELGNWRVQRVTLKAAPAK
jgi:hypothetical protein